MSFPLGYHQDMMLCCSGTHAVMSFKRCFLVADVAWLNAYLEFTKPWFVNPSISLKKKRKKRKEKRKKEKKRNPNPMKEAPKY